MPSRYNRSSDATAYKSLVDNYRKLQKSFELFNNLSEENKKRATQFMMALNKEENSG